MLDRLGLGIAAGRLGGRRASAQRPASSMPKIVRAAAPTPGRSRLLGRHEQRAQAGEAVGSDEAERDQLGQRLLDLRAQQAGAFDQLVEERGAVLADESATPPARGGLGVTASSAGDSDAQSGAWRRASRVIGVVRTGEARRSPFGRRCAAAAAPRRCGRRGTDRRARPARSRRGAPAGSRSPRRRPAPRSLRAGRRPRRARPAPPCALPASRAASRTGSAGSRARRPARSRRAAA